MILREYLYVDAAAVRGLLAQLDSGIAETESTTTTRAKKSVGGVKGFAEHAQDQADSVMTAKSMGDALFPALELALESEGLLRDYSDLISDPDAWHDGSLHGTLSPGRIVRLTAPGHLIDARFVASILEGFAVTHRGMSNMGLLKRGPEAVRPPSAKATSGKNRYKELPGEEASLEARIPLGELAFGTEDDAPLKGEFLRGIVQVARGMFTPGLHLVLTPGVEYSGAISIRLQEGRQYLDTDTDVLFARYGVGSQDWTVVGTIGHHPLPSPDMDEANFTDAVDGAVRRAEFGRYINKLGTLFGNLGFSDLPQAPGFSVVPWAIYRTLGSPS